MIVRVSSMLGFKKFYILFLQSCMECGLFFIFQDKILKKLKFQDIQGQIFSRNSRTHGRAAAAVLLTISHLFPQVKLVTCSYTIPMDRQLPYGDWSTSGRVNSCNVSPKVGCLPWGATSWKKADILKINSDDDDVGAVYL